MDFSQHSRYPSFDTRYQLKMYGIGPLIDWLINISEQLLSMKLRAWISALGQVINKSIL